MCHLWGEYVGTRKKMNDVFRVIFTWKLSIIDFSDTTNRWCCNHWWQEKLTEEIFPTFELIQFSVNNSRVHDTVKVSNFSQFHHFSCCHFHFYLNFIFFRLSSGKKNWPSMSSGADEGQKTTQKKPSRMNYVDSFVLYFNYSVVLKPQQLGQVRRKFLVSFSMSSSTTFIHPGIRK